MFTFGMQLSNDTHSQCTWHDVEKRKKRGNVWFPDLDSLMVAFNINDTGEDDTRSCSSSDSLELEEKCVRFGTIDIREYKVINGDHPSCKDGLALTLDWEYVVLEPMDIDETPQQGSASEEMNSSHLPETKNEISRPKRLNYFERRFLLEQAGYKVMDCYGDVRSSIWVCIDEELPPLDGDDEAS
jgi:hypothetical protein